MRVESAAFMRYCVVGRERLILMARIQPSLTKTESDLIDQVSTLTQTKRAAVIRNALAVYRWCVKQTILGARITAKMPTGEEVPLETPELGVLAGKACLLTPEELGRLSKRLSQGKDGAEADRLKDRLVRGFYGT